MSKKEKLIERFLARPSDFTFDELVTLLGYFGYSVVSSGNTGGSRVSFADSGGDYIRIHKPHPANILKFYQINDIITALMERGLL
jgi:hypothetical protein